MASFAGILKKIVGVGSNLSPVISVLVPGAAPVIAGVNVIVHRIQTAIATAEANDPRDKMGKLKERVVVEDFADSAELEIIQTVLAKDKKKLEWDEGKLKEVIASQVQTYNLFDDWIKSFKIKDI